MIVSLEHVSYKVGKSNIVDNVTTCADLGDIVGLVGPNGAGKSTLANLITGFVSASSGTIQFSGRPLNGLPPDQISRLGIGRTFQNVELPWNLSPSDCLLAILSTDVKNLAPSMRTRLYLHPNDDQSRVAKRILDLLGLSAAAFTPARDLSFGQQRLLGLAMAFVHSARLLILDEPFTGLKRAAVEAVTQLIREARSERATIIIDHALSELRELASRFWFMHQGGITEFPTFDAMTASEEFRSGYLGAKSSGYIGKSHNESHLGGASQGVKGPVSDREVPILALRDVTVGYRNRIVVEDINLAVYPGEVLGIVGTNGTGKSTILRAIMGLARIFQGEVMLYGRRVAQLTPDRMSRNGVRLLVQDNRLFKSLTVRDNLLVSGAALESHRRSFMPSTLTIGKQVKDRVDMVLRQANLRDESVVNRTAGTLSGGEQARIAFVQMQIGDPRLLLLDEPTSGIDGIALDSLRVLLQNFKSQGKAVILVEHALDFMADVASRIIIVSERRAREVDLSPAAGSAAVAEELLRRMI